MGWWSETVMGGDTPLDYKGFLCDAMGVPFDYKFTAEHLGKHMPAVVRAAEGLKDPIAFQVLGVMILESGAECPDDLKARIVDATKADEWAKNGDAVRIRHMTDLATKICLHTPGTTVEVPSEGLFDKFAEMIESGSEPGLVNKNRGRK
jgi:hypothetical protein